MSLESRKGKKASKSSKCPNKLQILKEKQVGQLSLAISKKYISGGIHKTLPEAQRTQDIESKT